MNEAMYPKFFTEIIERCVKQTTSVSLQKKVIGLVHYLTLGNFGKLRDFGRQNDLFIELFPVLYFMETFLSLVSLGRGQFWSLLHLWGSKRLW